MRSLMRRVLALVFMFASTISAFGQEIQKVSQISQSTDTPSAELLPPVGLDEPARHNRPVNASPALASPPVKARPVLKFGPALRASRTMQASEAVKTSLPLNAGQPTAVQQEGEGQGEPFVSQGDTETPPPSTEGTRWGPTLPEATKLLQNCLYGPCNKSGHRIYGWVETGYTYASTGSGRLATEPRPNYLGREFLVNEMALVLDKPLKQDELSFGYMATLWGGSTPALLRPRGGFTTTDPRMGVDFRDLWVGAHLPILTEGGVDLRAGRMTTIIGYESAKAPYRPFYSNSYQWFYSQDGAWTGGFANVHVNKQLDIINGITWGANTFFTTRANGPCYIGQVNYWLQSEKRTLLSASLHMGDQAIFGAPPGNFVTMWELRMQHDWNKYITQIIQSDNGTDQNVPNVGTASWWSLYTILINHVSPKLDLNCRAEWFYDVDNSRGGNNTLRQVAGPGGTHYYEVTIGCDYHPFKYLRIRPEVRYDWADNPAFGPVRNAPNFVRDQLTAAIDAVISF